MLIQDWEHQGGNFRWQAWKDWMGKKNYMGSWKNGEEDTKLGKRQAWHRNRWEEKARTQGQTWSWKGVSEEPMPHWKKNASCLFKECFCQVKGSKARKFQIKAACVTLAQSSLGYFYHNSHSDQQLFAFMASHHYKEIEKEAEQALIYFA